MVTFETKCYENDWEFILKGKYLDRMISWCNTGFTRKVVFINNVKDPEKVSYYAGKKVKKGIIDEYYIVSEYADRVLDFFKIERDSFKGGYYYSIAELTGIYLCTTPYLLHFSSDASPEKKLTGWISDAMGIMDKRDDVIVANPTWDFRYSHAEEESFGSIDNFYLGSGFSDQCYLIKTAVFKEPIYNEKHILSERYPEYGGELFEKRVDSYMKNHNLFRITSKNTSYVHENFPATRTERFRRKLDIYLDRK